ncbi:hypothetical protein IOC57_09640 [Bacillus sp. SD075]|uniref:hypothetical protein n=1 Tax=Bacillus sp. SD075 TaxID=2781732 RepID=UPI001A96AD62|nr:hypothetical protein [Bacillus sp. SD075]MBO0998009.1 hypothetical protein [Bacillus sp. SD075]
MLQKLFGLDTIETINRSKPVHHQISKMYPLNMLTSFIHGVWAGQKIFKSNSNQ